MKYDVPTRGQIAAKLVAIREQRGLLRHQLGQEIGVSAAYIAKVECGAYLMPMLEGALAFAKLHGMRTLIECLRKCGDDEAHRNMASVLALIDEYAERKEFVR